VGTIIDSIAGDPVEGGNLFAIPEGGVLVMAHPDDEALWASSVLGRIEEVVFCFGAIGSDPACSEGRRRSLSEYPYPNMRSLGIQEAEVFGGASWPNAVETSYGLAVRQSRQSMRGFSVSRYRKNYDTMVESLRPILRGRPIVITHNPWGEYGHEEHVQVFRAVAALQRDLGFSLWVPGYVSNRSYHLMLRSLDMVDWRARVLPTDPDAARALEVIYSRNECWTWYGNYIWPDFEYFYRLLDTDGPKRRCQSGSIVGMNMLWVNQVKRPTPRFVRAVRRALRVLGGWRAKTAS
jgi:LmbE family N-acetylglucosaminyl deacetylase